MPPRPVRRFTLIDAMILVAAAALGMAGIRAERTQHMHPTTLYFERPDEIGPPLPSSSAPSGWVGFLPISYVVNMEITYSPGAVSKGHSPGWFWVAWYGIVSARVASPGLAALSLAMLAIRLRRPRPPWPLMTRQAGFVASLGVIMALAGRLGCTLIRLTVERLNSAGAYTSTAQGPPPSRLSWIACQTIQPQAIGLVVLVCGLILVLGGRRRRGGGWVDRAGIAVGLGWVGLLVLDLFHPETL